MIISINKDAKKFMNEYTFNVIPVRHDKKAIADKEYARWFNEIWYEPIAEGQNIGVVLGRISQNLVCFDVDAHELYELLKKYEGQTFIVKSGKKGYHVYFRLMDIPTEYSGAKIIRDGKTIEFFMKDRFMVLPPSFIEGDSEQPYEVICAEKPKQLSRVELAEIFKMFQDNGCKIEYTKIIGSGGVVSGKARKSTHDLEIEDWAVGTRYDNGRDLTLRRFHSGWEYKQVEAEALKKNSSLLTPADYDHVIEWVEAGQRLYNGNLESDNGFFKPTKEFLKDNQSDEEKPDAEIFEKALELAEELDHKEALKELMEFNKELETPYNDIKVKKFLSMAEKRIKDKINAEFAPKKKHDSPKQIRAFQVGEELIQEKIQNENDTEQIIVKVWKNGKPVWIDLCSNSFEQLLRVNIQNVFGAIYGESIYQDAIKNLHAQALLSDIETKKIYKVCAMEDGCLYYNTNDDNGTIYKVSKDGIVKLHDEDLQPIFLKKQNIQAQINRNIEFDGPFTIKDFSKLCRIQDDDRIIFESHVICEFLKNIPIPIIVPHGEQGSAKTSISNAIKYLIDPEIENSLSMPENIDDLAVTASKREISSFDNIDELKKILSDFICRAVTGTQHPKRKLYTNGEEFNIILKEKFILNGITPAIDQPDLVERSIFYELLKIDKSERMTDDDFKEKLNVMRPYVVGHALQTIQRAMIIFDEVKTEIKKQLPRMASFAIWGEAISRVLGNENNKFLDDYCKKLETSSLSLSEEYPIIQPILNYMEHQTTPEVEIAVSHLFEIVAPEDQYGRRKTEMPQDVRNFGRQLKQIAPVLRTMGLEIITSTYNSTDKIFARGNKIVTITRLPEK